MPSGSAWHDCWQSVFDDDNDGNDSMTDSVSGEARDDRDSATVRLCCELVRRASVTPDDAGCQPLIAERLQRAGFAVEPMRHGEVDNLWARHGTAAPLLVLAGHTDVVPAGDATDWRHPPFEAVFEDRWLFGRGTADMKGGVAAMVTAAERFVARRPDHAGSVALLLTSDEEGPAVDGTVRVIDTLTARGEHIDHCVLGEPTSRNAFGDTVKNGRRGSLTAYLTVNGIQGHVAYPHLADNPVHRALAPLTALTAIEWDQGDEHFPPTTLQISNINAGTGADNVIPGHLHVTFNLRFNTSTTPERVKTTVHALFDKAGLDYRIDWRLSAEPFVTRPGTLTDALNAAIADTTGQSPALDTGGGTSDGRFVAPTGAQVVEFGVHNATIHQVNEHVDWRDLNTLSSIYENMLERLLGEQ